MDDFLGLMRKLDEKIDSVTNGNESKFLANQVDGCLPQMSPLTGMLIIIFSISNSNQPYLHWLDCQMGFLSPAVDPAQ